MSSRIRSRSLCSRLSRQGFPCSWCGLGAVLLFVMAYPPVAETSSKEIPVLFSTTSQEHTPFTFLQESGQNPPKQESRRCFQSLSGSGLWVPRQKCCFVLRVRATAQRRATS